LKEIITGATNSSLEMNWRRWKGIRIEP